MADEFQFDDSSWHGGDEDAPDNHGDGSEQMVFNPTSIRDRIDEKLSILADFKSNKERNPKISRADVLTDLSRDLCEYYGYIPDLSDLFLGLFSPAECVEFMDASDRPRPLVIRTNTLKITRKDLMDALGKRGVNLEAIEWSKVAIKVIESTVPIGATPEYLAGYYMLQAASSLCPVVALDPQPGEKILDMSAAPGGKTTYISQLMKNSGSIIANDLKPQRQKATVANMHRMGVKNAIVCCYDGRKVPQTFKGFDRVLLDAPCSGLGVIARDQTVKLQRTLKDVQRLAHLQKELLCAAVDAVDPKSSKGGVIVYSTCSVSVEENEQVIQYILNKRYVRLIETGLDVGRPGYTRHKERRFHPSLALTRRFYPHVHNMDGFYVAKLLKYENGPRTVEDNQFTSEDQVDDASDEGEEEEDSNSDVEEEHQDDESEQESASEEEEKKSQVKQKVLPSNSNKKNGTLDQRGAVVAPIVASTVAHSTAKSDPSSKILGKRKSDATSEMSVLAVAKEPPSSTQAKQTIVSNAVTVDPPRKKTSSHRRLEPEPEPEPTMRSGFQKEKDVEQEQPVAAATKGKRVSIKALRALYASQKK